VGILEERDAFWMICVATVHSANGMPFRDRDGRRFTMLASADLIQLNDVPHMLAMALDITERKRAEGSCARARRSCARSEPVSRGVPGEPDFHRHSPNE